MKQLLLLFGMVCVALVHAGAQEKRVTIASETRELSPFRVTLSLKSFGERSFYLEEEVKNIGDQPVTISMWGGSDYFDFFEITVRDRAGNRVPTEKELADEAAIGDPDMQLRLQIERLPIGNGFRMQPHEIKPNDIFSFVYALDTVYRFKPGGEYQIDLTAKLMRIQEIPCRDCLPRAANVETSYELDFHTMKISVPF